MTTLGIIGAGAKAAAIIARAYTLHALGAKVPKILVFEADHIGSAWSGSAQYSSGFLTLCTPGEKDVGFPYDEIAKRKLTNKPVAPELFARFSWSAFLVDTGRISEWVDRGRDYPTHRVWSDYLKWIFEKTNQSVLNEKVDRVSRAGNKWHIETRSDNSINRHTVDAVVITGTGKSKKVAIGQNVPSDRIFDAETFWSSRETIINHSDPTIAIAGDGGAAGAIISWLARNLSERDASIVSISPMGTLFPRGDGYTERRWFSDPTDWAQLNYEHRRKLLDYTEAGVISVRNKNVIDASAMIGFQRGKAKEVDWDGDELVINMEYDGSALKPYQADYFVAAIGFDQWSLLDIVDDNAVKNLISTGAVDMRRKVEEEFLPDLTLPPISGLPAGLHIPALGGLAHGPGMGNLGCLGLMAERVLRPHVK